jgi:hypothetical protein
MKNDKNKKKNFRRKYEPFIFDDGLYYKKISLSERLKVMSNTLNILYVTYVSLIYTSKIGETGVGWLSCFITCDSPGF